MSKTQDLVQLHEAAEAPKGLFCKPCDRKVRRDGYTRQANGALVHNACGQVLEVGTAAPAANAVQHDVDELDVCAVSGTDWRECDPANHVKEGAAPAPEAEASPRSAKPRRKSTRRSKPGRKVQRRSSRRKPARKPPAAEAQAAPTRAMPSGTARLAVVVQQLAEALGEVKVTKVQAGWIVQTFVPEASA